MRFSAYAEGMRSGLKSFISQYGKYFLTVAFGVLLFELIEHLPALGSFFCAVKKAAAPVLYGLAAAYVLFIPVRFLETRALKRLYTKNRRAARAAAMTLVYAAAVGAAAAIAVLVAPRIADAIGALAESIEEFASSAPETLDSLLMRLDGSGELGRKFADVADSLAEKLKTFMPELIPRALGLAVNAMSAAYSVALSFVISVYAVSRKEKLLSQARRLLTALLPEHTADSLFGFCASANKVFRRYVTGQALSCAFVGAACYLGMRVLNMPYPELISAFIGAAALIPVVGPWISTVPSALIILTARRENPMLALWFIIMILLIQLFDDNVVYPKVVGGAVGISGIWVLSAVLIGGGLFGLPGLFLAVPVTAVVYRMIGDWTNKRTKPRQNG